MKKSLRILLADDHQMFRDALRSLLEKSPHIKVVGETGDGLEVVKLAQATTPDIICMDIGMPGMNGIEATRRLSTLCPETKIIAVSAFAEQRYAMDMFDAGATAYVTKSGAGEELLRAIEAVQNGQKYVCPRIASLIAGTWSSQRDIKLSPPLQLGARERQVLQLVAEGHTSQQIATQLFIAHSTVEVHRRNIMRKLDLHNVAELTRYAINHGFAPN
ncbi:MAG: response regulator transcription factor [Rhodocyclaceae bacterium]|nr:response regulator transcription factor [Rhodocyclaceae bacterium]MDZ4213926.1 response regulator transcription factor [Rhodocyclaceae bacterium]